MFFVYAIIITHFGAVVNKPFGNKKSTERRKKQDGVCQPSVDFNRYFYLPLPLFFKNKFFVICPRKGDIDMI